MYDRPFFYIFLCMDEANLANEKTVKRNLVGRELSDFFYWRNVVKKRNLKLKISKKGDFGGSQ